MRRRIALGVLLDHGEDEARPLLGEQRLHLLDALADRARVSPVRASVSESCFCRSLRSVTTTTLKRRSVRTGPHLAHQEDHGQALARSLGVPDDAAAPVVLAVLCRVLPLSRRSTACWTARYCW